VRTAATCDTMTRTKAGYPPARWAQALPAVRARRGARRGGEHQARPRCLRSRRLPPARTTSPWQGTMASQSQPSRVRIAASYAPACAGGRARQFRHQALNAKRESSKYKDRTRAHSAGMQKSVHVTPCELVRGHGQRTAVLYHEALVEAPVYLRAAPSISRPGASLWRRTLARRSQPQPRRRRGGSGRGGCRSSAGAAGQGRANTCPALPAPIEPDAQRRAGGWAGQARRGGAGARLVHAKLPELRAAGRGARVVPEQVARHQRARRPEEQHDLRAMFLNNTCISLWGTSVKVFKEVGYHTCERTRSAALGGAPAGGRAGAPQRACEQAARISERSTASQQAAGEARDTLPWVTDMLR